MPANATTTTGTGAEPIVIGVADLAVAALDRQPADRLTTYALGSCIGLTAYDPVAKVGGLLHFMLPQPGENDVERNEAMYGSTGVPKLFDEIEALGGRRSRFVLVAAGAAEVIARGRAFAIGQRNRTMLRKVLWKAKLTLAAEDTGGNQARTMSLQLTDGTVLVRGRGKEEVLWQP